MPLIVFYEIDETSSSPLPELQNAEGVIFDYINNQGAASMKGVYRFAAKQGYMYGDASNALDTLQNKGLITRRNVTVEQDEVKRG